MPPSFPAKDVTTKRNKFGLVILVTLQVVLLALSPGLLLLQQSFLRLELEHQ